MLHTENSQDQRPHDRENRRDIHRLLDTFYFRWCQFGQVVYVRDYFERRTNKKNKEASLDVPPFVTHFQIFPDKQCRVPSPADATCWCCPVHISGKNAGHWFPKHRLTTTEAGLPSIMYQIMTGRKSPIDLIPCRFH
jgi:hypothetical protein